MLVGRHRITGLNDMGPGEMVEPVLYGLRANDAKRGKIEAFPTTRSEKEIEAFL